MLNRILKVSYTAFFWHYLSQLLPMRKQLLAQQEQCQLMVIIKA